MKIDKRVTMEIDKWVGTHKVRAIPWFNRGQIYVNVQYYAPNQNIEKPPVWDKTVYVTDDEAGRRLVFEYTHTLVDYISTLNIVKGRKIVITVCPSGAPMLRGAKT